MQAAEGTTEELISSARDFLTDKSPAWETVRGARGGKDDEPDAPGLPKGAKLFPYQDACVLGTLAHWGSGQKELVHRESSKESSVAKVVLPTGTGKSWVIAVLALAMVAKKKRVLIVTPNEEIRGGLLLKLQEFQEYFKNFKKKLQEKEACKIVVLVARGDGNKKRSTGRKAQEEKQKPLRVNFEVVEELDSDAFKGADIVVSNYQTITSNHGERIIKDGITPFDVVLVDEAHHGRAKSYRMLFEECKPDFLCNLTATPIDSQGNDICGTRVPPGKNYTLAWAETRKPPLVKKRRLVQLPKMEGEMPSETEAEDESSRTSRGKRFPESMLAKHFAIAKKTFEECMRLRKLSGQPHVALAKAVNKAQADQLLGVYNVVTKEYGYDYAEVLHSDLPKGEREQILKKLEKGECMVCIVVGMLGEGYDNQLISVIAWHCVTNSNTRFYQFLGRGLRRLQLEYLEKNNIQGACKRPDLRGGNKGPLRWPPGDPENIENKQVITQVNLDEKEQECVMVVSHADFSEMQRLYENIGGDLEGKREAVELDSSHEERPTLLEDQKKRKRDVETKQGRNRAKRPKPSDDEISQRWNARKKKQMDAADRIDAGHKADSLFNDNADRSGILSLERHFEKWQMGNNGQKDANKWRNDPAIGEKDKKLLEDLENPDIQHEWRCHLYRRAVKDLADGGSKVNRDEALKRVSFRWRRAIHNSPVLQALLDEMDETLVDKIPKDEPLFFTVEFKKADEV